jgi:hypothetical protein
MRLNQITGAPIIPEGAQQLKQIRRSKRAAFTDQSGKAEALESGAPATDQTQEHKRCIASEQSS